MLSALIPEPRDQMWKIVPRDEKFFDQIEQLSHLAKSSAQ
jgi:hypothetical protein